MESQDLSGGIIVVGKDGVAFMDVMHQYTQQAIIIIMEVNVATWLLSGVYASTDYLMQRMLWREMSSLIDQGISIVVGGDFNYIIGPHEKSGVDLMLMMLSMGVQGLHPS